MFAWTALFIRTFAANDANTLSPNNRNSFAANEATKPAASILFLTISKSLERFSPFPDKQRCQLTYVKFQR